MRVAITGGTGLVGGNLAHTLLADGHEVVLIARGEDPRIGQAVGEVVRASVVDEDALAKAFEGCDAVVHCAGINREIGSQTYENVHVRGTRSVVNAAKRAGTKRIALTSYLTARPQTGSGYLDSKWGAEEIVRGSGLEYLVVKAGVIYGRGDQMIGNASKTIGTFRTFAKIGIGDCVVSPVAVRDIVEIIRAFVVDGELVDRSVAVVGPEEMPLAETGRRIGRAMGVRTFVVPAPIWLLRILAWLAERAMKVPMIAIAQVRLLLDGVEPGPFAEPLPESLVPRTRLTEDVIRAGLPDRTRFGWRDLRVSRPSRIVLETKIAAPPARCFGLAIDVDVHLSVPGARETVDGGVRSGRMSLGDHVTWRSTRFGLPVRLTSLITEYDDPRLFVDEMQSGPFRSWRHVHRFESSDGGTRMVDEVEYSLPLGPLGRVADAVFVRRYMTKLLRDQNAHIKRLAEQPG
ncbi:MAG TPA: NAD(P)H-binding protein [Actinomycetota bacterium]|jgi:NADH dehydrogenase|nr:NAD(P)H-binding protein [Actinomycetota bacterium]